MKKENWLSYYKGHYLSSVAELFSGNKEIEQFFKEDLFKSSKKIKNQRERKKILKTIYHNYNLEHPFFKDKDRILLSLKKNNFTSQGLAFYLNTKNFSDYNSVLKDIDKFNKFGEDTVKITHPDFDLKSYLSYSKKFNKKIEYPNFFDDVKDCISGFTLEPVENIKDAFELSKKYQNCWQSTMGHLIKSHDFFLINLRNTDDVLIGTLRYLTLKSNVKGSNEMQLSGWVNPDVVNGKTWFEFSESLLKEISQKIYEKSLEDSYAPENMRISLHYNSTKRTVSSLLPWNKKIENEITDFIGDRINEQKVENNLAHLLKNKRNRLR